MNDYPEAVDSAEALPLDPFGSCPDWASLIVGLGGGEPSPDPAYVFATMYSRPAIGRVCATVRFHDLAMTRGTLLFEVRVRSVVPGSEHSRLQTKVIDAAELVAAGGVVELDFESYRNAYYAIACGINDETDITASAISITLDRQPAPFDHGREWEWKAKATGRRTGIEGALIGRIMTDLALPRLEEPVSQVGSPLQCREPAFADAMRALGRLPTGSFENWSLAFVLRAIDRFAVTGARRMLGFGYSQETLLSYFAAREYEVVGMQHPSGDNAPFDPGAALERLWVPELCGEADFFNHARVIGGDIRQSFAALHDQFDVLWSIGANRLMTPQEYVYFVVNGLIHARPGALAVHVFDYIEDVDAERGANLNRHDIERIAALALSHANDVVRLRFLHGGALPDKRAPLPFGLILLRGGAQT